MWLLYYWAECPGLLIGPCVRAPYCPGARGLLLAGSPGLLIGLGAVLLIAPGAQGSLLDQMPGLLIALHGRVSLLGQVPGAPYWARCLALLITVFGLPNIKAEKQHSKMPASYGAR